MKNYMVISLGVLIIGLSFQVQAGKKECKKHLKKLQNVQSLQRQGGSLKKTQSLRKREDKARKKWWACEKGK